MQIVIDIEDTAYTRLVNSGYVSFNVINVVRQGTLLPKRHGRLIDADALNRKDVNCANVPMNFIDIAPTIVEADTESEKV